MEGGISERSEERKTQSGTLTKDRRKRVNRVEKDENTEAVSVIRSKGRKHLKKLLL